MIKLSGRIEVNNGVRIKTNSDICRYYQWLINKAFYKTIKFQSPKHGGHLSISLPKFHGNKDALSKHWHGKIVDFYIEPAKMWQTRKNFLIPAYCEAADLIRKELGIKDKSLHLTVCNMKFN